MPKQKLRGKKERDMNIQRRWWVKAWKGSETKISGGGGGRGGHMNEE